MIGRSPIGSLGRRLVETQALLRELHDRCATYEAPGPVAEAVRHVMAAQARTCEDYRGLYGISREELDRAVADEAGRLKGQMKGRAKGGGR